MSRVAKDASWLLLPALLLGVSLSAGCKDSDACKGRSETCLSVTLQGAEGVGALDQLQVMVQRKPNTDMTMMALSSGQELPFKVAVLWQDGPATLSVRGLRGGQVQGVTPEIALDLRNGKHAQQLLTLYPPIVGGMGLDAPDMAKPPADMAKPPADMTVPEDLTKPEDLSDPSDSAVPPTGDM